jgi:hypothetical protein
MRIKKVMEKGRKALNIRGTQQEVESYVKQLSMDMRGSGDAVEITGEGGHALVVIHYRER